MEKELPNKPSDLIDIALNDLEACERDNYYIIDMNTWHSPARGNARPPCVVCMSGAVMSKSLGISVHVKTSPDNFLEDAQKKLIALDCFRRGKNWDVMEGLSYMGVPQSKIDEITGIGYVKQPFSVSPYHEDPAVFKTDMKSMSSIFSSHGL